MSTRPQLVSLRALAHLIFHAFATLTGHPLGILRIEIATVLFTTRKLAPTP